MPRRLLCLAVVLAATAPASASAAPPWSAAEAVPGAPVAFPSFTFAANGQGVALWNSERSGRAAENAFGATFAAGGFRRTRPVYSGVRFDHAGAFGANRLVVAGTRGFAKPRAISATGSPAGGFIRARAIGPPGRESTVAALAVNRRGDTAVLILVRGDGPRGADESVPYLVVRAAGRGRFPGRPVRLATGGPVLGGAVAVNQRGDVLVTWAQPSTGTTGERSVYARMRPASDRRLGSVRRLGRASAIPSLSAALGDDRRAVVAWTAGPASAGETPAAAVQVAVAPARGPFLPARSLETVRPGGAVRIAGQPGVRVALASDGRPVVAWTGSLGGRFVIRVAPVEGTEVGGAQVVSDAAQDSNLSDLVTGPRGEVIVLGLEGRRPDAVGEGMTSVVAAARSPGADAFGPTELVDGPGGFEAVDADADPVTGRIVAVWRDFGGGAIRSSVREQVAAP